MNKRNLILALIVVLCAVAVIRATYAFFTDEDEVVNTFKVGDLDIELDEDWEPEDGEDMELGDTVVKEPVVTATRGDGYMRVVMTIRNRDVGMVGGKYPAITNAPRLSLILQTLFHDTAGGTVVPGTSYTLSDISGWTNVYSPYNEDDFELKSSTGGVYVFWYIGGAAATPYIFEEGATATLFTHVVIPEDWTNTELELLGKYDIEIRAEAIQASGFSTPAAAFAALDTELAP